MSIPESRIGNAKAGAPENCVQAFDALEISNPELHLMISMLLANAEHNGYIRGTDEVQELIQGEEA